MLGHVILLALFLASAVFANDAVQDHQSAAAALAAGDYEKALELARKLQNKAGSAPQLKGILDRAERALSEKKAGKADEQLDVSKLE